MEGLYLLLPTLITIFASFLIVRASAILLMMTGLDRKRAIFQALSAFTGTGFTTREAERVINNPRRRKIISWLMVLGNAGIITVIITASSSLITSHGYRLPMNAFFLIVGIFIVYKIVSSRGFIRSWDRFIEDRVAKRDTLEEELVEDLLHLLEGFTLIKAIIRKDSPLKGDTIHTCTACGDKILVLGIEREKHWIPIPPPDEVLQEGDRIVIYGREQELRDLFSEKGQNS